MSVAGTLFLAASALAASAPAGDPVPTLSHDAPFLGRDVTLTVKGAPPLAPVRLFQSPVAGQRALPFGVLELGDAGLALAAQGTADEGGVFAVSLPLPSDPGSAEAERHWQALVVDAGAPAGAVLSTAAHVRILGPRAYAVFDGLASGPPLPGGLTIASAVGPAPVATVDLGAPAVAGQALGDARPVLRADQARGAAMASPFELALFDPFFGGLVARVPFQEASRTLLVAPGGELCVLETGIGGGTARVHALDFEDGTPLWTATLPEVAAGLWVADADGRAWIAETDAATGRLWVRGLDLADGTDLGAFRVGTLRAERFTDLAQASGQLLVGTATPWGPFTVQAELTRVDLAALPSAGTVSTFPGASTVASLTPVPPAGLALFATFDGGLPEGDLWKARLGGTSPPAAVGTPAPTLGIADLAPDDPSVWAIVFAIDGDHGDRLYHLDLPTATWTELGTVPCGSRAGVAIERLRDAYVDTLVYAVEHCGPVGLQDPMLVFRDPATGFEATVPLGFGPRSLRVVAVP